MNEMIKNPRLFLRKLSKMVFSAEALPFDIRRIQLENHILNSSAPGVTDEEYIPGQKIVVSLTSYGARIYDVALTIESLMQQTMKANAIVLWLDESLQSQPLPVALQRQQARGLTVGYTKDIKAYKKLIPSLQRYPNDAIITVDDDMLYDYDLLEHLIMAYKKDQSYIYAHRQHLMKLDAKGCLLPYREWDRCVPILHPTPLAFPTGGGGVLYPPHALDDEVMNESVFMDICPYADDVWFKAMALKNGKESCGVFSHNYLGDFVVNAYVQEQSLNKINNGSVRQNNVQIKAVFDKYNLYEKLHGKEK